MADEKRQDKAPPTTSRTAAASRRSFLAGLGAGSVLSVVPGARPASAAAPKPPAGPATQADLREHARLRALDLDSAKVVAERKKMPVGKIRDLSLGRLICGSNLISMNMHARDLRYVNALAAHYNTEERIFMTLKLCEAYGVNSIVLKHHNFRRFRLSRYWKEWGGKTDWIADVITTDIDKYEKLLVEHLSLGASAAYLWGGASDIWYGQNKQRNIVKAVEIMRKYEVPVGVCAHHLEPIKFCEAEGLEVDFYMKTLHHDRYWSAHPKANRRLMEMYKGNSSDHRQYHDNLFCRDHDETIEFMQSVKVPWIAFKVLAAGAIAPKDAFRDAFAGGADFICLGMFDFQVAEDAQWIRQAVARAKGRKRPWA